MTATMGNDRLARAYEDCRLMQRRKDPTFYLATMRLPADIRPAVHALYGFVRTADEIVDGEGRPSSATERLSELDRLEQELAEARVTGEASTPVVVALVDASRRHDLPLDELGPYLNSMRRDVEPLQITDWADLESYMEGSAGSVGRIMSVLLGAPQAAQASFAKLGLAFQLTNFIRDFEEDLALGRVYLPADELAEAGVDPQSLAATPANEALRSVVARQVGRARELFVEGRHGAESVNPSIRRGIGFARAIYVRTLDRVESLGFDVTSRKVSLPPLALASAAMDGLRGKL